MIHVQPNGVGREIVVSGGVLLEHIHVSQLRIELRTELVSHPDKQPVLIGRIVNHILSETQEQLVCQHCEGCLCHNLLSLQWNQERKIISHPESIDRKSVV